MKKSLCAICFLVCLLRLSAQNITAAEYFFDVDPGKGLGTSLSVGTPAMAVNFTVPISTASLSTGFHTLAIRTKDANNVWSLYESSVVYISTVINDAAPINGAEYFFDNDPGVGAGYPLSVGATENTVNFTVSIPTSSLSLGFHTLAIRTRNASGQWSFFETRAFYISTLTVDAAVTAAEYFVDADPGLGNGTLLSIGTAGNTVNFVATVSTTNIAGGIHTLAIRTKNANGVWSLFETRPFYISIGYINMAALTAAEYFIDADPGVGNGSSLNVTMPGNIISQTFFAPVPPGIATGQHFLAIRTRDANGVWSLFDTARFTVAGALPLDWISFTGSRLNDKVVLKWTTENEITTSHFVIERSKNGIDFSLIGNEAAKGAIHNDYTYEDLSSLQGLNFYRLKQVDKNGQFKYSIIIKIYFGGDGNLKLYPVPVSTDLRITFNGSGATIFISVYDAAGKMVINERKGNGSVTSVNMGLLAKGSYWIVVSDGITQQTGKFTKE